ncbi:MAG: YfhO family protein [Magnetococcales bacterium]|nr:YfhO family protein [Magnetococcales bacterium]
MTHFEWLAPANQPKVPEKVFQDNSIRWTIFWLLWSLLISAIYWALGPNSYLRIQDNADANLPYRILAAKNILEYGLIFWQTKIISGIPFLINPFADSLLVDHLPYLFLPGWAAYGLIMWLQRFVAGYFTFRLCREILKLDEVSALFAGLSFSLYRWNVHDACLWDALGLPAIALILLLFSQILTQSIRRSVPLSILLGMLVGLTGHSVVYTSLLIIAWPFWFLIVQRTHFSQLWPRYTGWVVGVILAELPSIVAMLSFSPLTARWQSQTHLAMPSWNDLFKQFWEDWSAMPQNGLFLALFVLGMLASRFLKDRIAWSVMLLFVLTALGAELGHGLQLYFQDTIPPSRGNLKDLNQLLLFLGPLLGGIGLDRLRSRGINTNRAIRIPIALVVLCALLIPLWRWGDVTRSLMHRLSTDNYAINFENPVLRDLSTLNKKEPLPFRVATVGAWPATIASASGGRFYPAYANAYGLESVDGYFSIHYYRYDNYWKRVIAKALDHFPELRPKSSIFYYLFMTPEERFADRTPLELRAWFNLDLLSLANTRFLISHWPLNDPSLVLRHDPQDELAQGREWEQLRLRDKVWRTVKKQVPHHALYLYENQAVLPRAFMVERTRCFSDAVSLLDALATTPSEEMRYTAFVEKKDFNCSGESAWQRGKVTWEHARPDQIILTTESAGSGLLVITNNYDPNWRVTINGQPGTVQPVYHTFQGILLPAGQNRVILDFWPPYR